MAAEPLKKPLSNFESTYAYFQMLKKIDEASHLAAIMSLLSSESYRGLTVSESRQLVVKLFNEGQLDCVLDSPDDDFDIKEMNFDDHEDVSDSWTMSQEELNASYEAILERVRTLLKEAEKSYN